MAWRNKSFCAAFFQKAATFFPAACVRGRDDAHDLGPRAVTALLEIDLDAIAANWRALDAMHAGRTAGVVKADAYGLGAAQVAPKLLAIGCRHFFTAHVSEALAIRALLPGAMLAVLNGILPGEAEEFAARDIVPVCGALA